MASSCGSCACRRARSSRWPSGRGERPDRPRRGLAGGDGRTEHVGGGALRYALPQPFEEIAHTADVGVRVDGRSAEEALARLCLALSALLAGGGEVLVEREAAIEVAAGADPSQTAVAVLRELLFRFATERVIAGSVEVVRLDDRGAALRVGFGRFDPARHEGADVKAVTYHLARFGREGDRWRAQVVLDI